MKDKKALNQIYNDNKKTVIILSLIFILCILFVVSLVIIPQYIVSSSEDVNTTTLHNIDDSQTEYYPDRNFVADLSYYDFGITMQEISAVCGTPNERGAGFLKYYYVYYNNYMTDITFLFDEDMYYGGFYDVIGQDRDSKIKIDDYFIIKNSLIKQFGEPVKESDDKTTLISGEIIYCRFETQNAFIKMQYTKNDDKDELVIGYKSKTAS